MSMWSEFKAFLVKQNVLALAIAVVVGTALNQLVTALVESFKPPLRRGPPSALPDRRLRGLAAQQGVHPPGGSRSRGQDLPVLQDEHRRGRDPLPALHEPIIAISYQPSAIS